MLSNSLWEVEMIGQPECLWRVIAKGSRRVCAIAPPVFEVDGSDVTMAAALAPAGGPISLLHGVTEHRLRGGLADDPGLSLEMVVQVGLDSPVFRFRYELHSARPARLTRRGGRDNLTYLGTSFRDLPETTEVRLSEFNERVHSFCPSERDVSARDFENALSQMGPILVGSDGAYTLLLAYEHGSQVPDAFVTYDLAADRGVALRAVKGSYVAGQPIGPQQPYQTLWLHAACLDGDRDEMAHAYRDFVLRRMTANAESRRPYVFYNTWNFQERNRWWNGQPYLESMNQARILAEIDVAHRMGIDVFVLDTGWYEKTGDWRVNLQRFPDGLKAVKAKLDAGGMKLGLWFNPTVAAVSSRMRGDHEDCLMTWRGKPSDPHEVWETEASQGLCLVSRYWQAFADELIRLSREVGVTYFKWDAIGQYGCDDPGHFHGTAENTPEERADSYAFQQAAYMARVVDRLCAACPEAVVDFDITEGGRSVGLGFLSAGKYFLVNNGPYSSNYDMPVPRDGNVNLFFFPGPARAWVCRTPLTYDKWIPSVLFLTHYLPDDRYRQHDWAGGGAEIVTDANQWISLASLVLGQNGVWGDLLSITDAGVRRFGDALARYKQVRDDITAVALIRTGAVGGSPEVYEKINPANGRGVVSVFASARGRYAYVTQSAVSPDVWHNDGVSVTHDGAGRAKIEMEFDGPTAKFLFFGVRP